MNKNYFHIMVIFMGYVFFYGYAWCMVNVKLNYFRFIFFCDTPRYTVTNYM